jgi:predicted metal-dependent hydrolase
VGIRDITVVVPDGVEADPESLLRDHEDWVLEKKAKFDRYREEAPDRFFEEGETVPYRGEPHELVVERRSSSVVEDGMIRLAEHHVDQTSIQQALEKLYRRKAREQIEEHLEHYADAMGVEYDKLEVRNQRTKLGSCSSSGTLGINWRLVMAPPEILEYVVIHELAHLEEGNHTDDFWNLVAKYDADYTAHADWLEENSAQLIFTEEDL